MTMFKGLKGRLYDFNVGSPSPNKKLLDININFDGKYPIITYTYFDKDNKAEIIETYQASSINIERELEFTEYNLSRVTDYFNTTYNLEHMMLIKREINKL